jgi:hypothetical protein
VAVDDEVPRVVAIEKDLVVGSSVWSQNVLNATTTGTSTHKVTKAGPHVLRIYMIDPGVVLDKIVIDTGGLRPSYFGPAETIRKAKQTDPRKRTKLLELAVIPRK